MQIFSGLSNKELAEKIAKLHGAQIGQVESTKFENGEARVRVITKGKGGAVLIQSLSNPVDEHLIEFCLLSDALSRQGYADLIGVIPYLGYSKQDKIFLPGEALSAKVVAQIIQTTKIKKLITFDLHNRAITGFFDIPVVELSAKSLFLEYFGQKTNTDDWVVVAPDAGAVKASAYFARELSVPIAYMDKRRDLKTGDVEVVGMTGEVKGKRVIIVDDMIVTGSTMKTSAKYLKKMGARSVAVVATHHLYLPQVQDKLEMSEIDEIVVSDSIRDKGQGTCLAARRANDKYKKLKVLSVAQLIVDELS